MNGSLNIKIQFFFVLESEGEVGQQDEGIVGIPRYIASGSHYFNDRRYRFLIMPRYKADLHSIIKNGRLSQKHFLIIASQIIDVLMHLHSKHYVHSDIKAENIMIGLHKSLNGQKLLNGCQKSSKTSDFTGIVPFTSCRGSSRQPSRSLRPSKSVAYVIEENSRSTHCLESDNESSDSSMGDEDFELTPRKRKARKAINKAKAKKNASKVNKSKREELSVVSRNIFEDQIISQKYLQS